MNPKPLGITQPIILRLNLNKHHLVPMHIPQEQIRDPATALLVLLRKNLAHSRQRLAAETPHDLDQVVQFE